MIDFRGQLGLVGENGDLSARRVELVEAAGVFREQKPPGARNLKRSRLDLIFSPRVGEVQADHRTSYDVRNCFGGHRTVWPAVPEAQNVDPLPAKHFDAFSPVAVRSTDEGDGILAL